MDEIVVKPAARRQSGYLLLSAAGAAFCLLLTILERPFEWRNLLVTLVFLLCFAFFFRDRILPKRAVAVLGENGITVRQGKEQPTIPWSEIENPRVIRATGKREFLSFDLRDEELYFARCSDARRKVIEGNRKMGYGLINISTEQADVSAAQLYEAVAERLRELGYAPSDSEGR